jgi:hypothetical protein
MTRKFIPSSTQANVLLRARRRCCICFGLNRDIPIKPGQIAHLDRSSANNVEDNLAFLCFNHHDQYDSTTRQSKNFTLLEVKQFRSELHAAMRLIFDVQISFGEARNIVDSIPGHYIRDGEFESAELKVELLADGRFHISGLALWGKQHKFGPNLGELDFIGELAEDTIEYSGAYLGGKSYRAWLRFTNGHLVVTEENWLGIFGMNVNFSGTYAKAN